uniref:Putative secreted protein n=1 Tax=Anopheles darlingi TaxID=43151 RepID=A0A2M4DQW9_ANODA
MRESFMLGLWLCVVWERALHLAPRFLSSCAGGGTGEEPWMDGPGTTRRTERNGTGRNAGHVSWHCESEYESQPRLVIIKRGWPIGDW